ncbi:MAG: hypothetical protein M1825_004017 [Sarcosagium campestre]|nr:MAG: hypothetical protein M1825_004017 [Sarcosagium campestre]
MFTLDSGSIDRSTRKAETAAFTRQGESTEMRVEYNGHQSDDSTLPVERIKSSMVSGRDSEDSPVKSRSIQYSGRQGKDQRWHQPPAEAERNADRKSWQVYQERFNQKLKYKSPLSEDFPLPLQVLIDSTETRPLPEERVIHRMGVPERLVPHLLQSLGESLWDLAALTECDLALLRREQADDDQRDLLIQGSSSAIRVAADAVHSILRRRDLQLSGRWANDFGYRTSSNATMGQAKMLIHGVWSAADETLPQRRADQIPLPKTLSTESVAQYTQDVCRAPMTRAAGRALYGPSTSHVDAIESALERIFSSRPSNEFLTPFTLNTALARLTKLNKIKTCREIFLQSEMVDCGKNAETFNILLRGAAAARDRHNFTFILQLMILQGFRPNAGTWLAFLSMAKSPEAKSAVLRNMQSKRLLLDVEVLQRAVSHVISDHFRSWIGPSKEPIGFLEHMDMLYGPHWPSPTSANRLLDEMGNVGVKVTDYDPVWTALHERGVRLDGVSMNTVLSHCARRRSEQGVLEALRLGHSSGLKATELTYQSLLHLAVKRRLLNVARVAWRHACVNGLVSFRTQARVYRSLLERNLASEPGSSSQAFKTCLGKVAAGILLSERLSLRREAERLIYSESDSITDEAEPEGNEQLRRQLCRQIIDEDIASFQWLRSTRPLYKMIEQALEMDRQWHADQVWKTQSTTWKVRNAIRVPLVGRHGLLTTRTLSPSKRL